MLNKSAGVCPQTHAQHIDGQTMDIIMMMVIIDHGIHVARSTAYLLPAAAQAGPVERRAG